MPRAAPAARERVAWTYVSGLVSALDTRLLSQRATQELLNSDGLRELSGRVRQTLMFADLPETDAPFGLVEAMQASYAAAVRRIAEASPNRAVGDLFLLPLEWQAFRSFLREKALEPVGGGASAPRVGRGGPVQAVPGSATAEAVWERCWAGQEPEPPFAPFAEAATTIRDAAPREERTPQLVDAITQLFEARHLRDTSQALGSEEIAQWVGAWLTLRVALAMLRARFNQWAGAVNPALLDELGEAKQAAAALGSQERRDWRAVLASLGLAAAQGIPEDEALPAVAVERLIDDAMTALVRSGRSVAFGPEPVFAFLWGLRVEAINLRTIMAGVAAGLPREAIAADIRQTYG